MHINLKSHTVNHRQAAHIALLDSIIWLWFHQIVYGGPFVRQFLAPHAIALPDLIMSVALAIGIARARWDRVPKGVRAITALGASAALLGFIVIPQTLGESGTATTVLTLTLSVLVGMAAILRMETLAKCTDFATLTVALSGSLMLFYGLNLVLILVPDAVNDAFVVLAPLALLAGIGHPVADAQRQGPLPKKLFRTFPFLLPCLMGLCLGFVVALGTVYMATSPGELFTHPSPLFLLSQMLFLCLIIVAAFGLKLRKASYFAITNLAWGMGGTAGNVINSLGLVTNHALVYDVASFICLAIIVAFLAFSGIWVNSLERNTGQQADAVADIAREAGLTKRETEVAKLMLEGRSLRVIQEELYISEGTARTHAKRIYSKLGIHSKQELIDFFKHRLEH